MPAAPSYRKMMAALNVEPMPASFMLSGLLSKSALVTIITLFCSFCNPQLSTFVTLIQYMVFSAWSNQINSSINLLLRSIQVCRALWKMANLSHQIWTAFASTTPQTSLIGAYHEIDGGNTCSISTRELREWVEACVKIIGTRERPQVVAIALPSCSLEESAVAVAVASQPQWLFVPINERASVDEQQKILTDVRADNLITWRDSRLAKRLRELESRAQVSTLPPLTPSSSSHMQCFHFHSITTVPPWYLTDMTDEDPLYVLFTSGSTGDAKGVVGTRRGARERIAWAATRFPVKHRMDCVLRATPLSFVDAVAEIIGAVITGVTLVHVCTKEDDSTSVPSVMLRSPPVIARVIAQYTVTRITTVPTIIRAFLRALRVDEHRHLSSLRLVMSSGEPLRLADAELIRDALPDATLVNLYGSTEVSGDVTWFLLPPLALLSADRLQRWRANGVPVSAWPIDPVGISSRVRIVDGELRVSGGALSLGYFQPGRLTRPATKYLNESDGSWFRMGDLCHVIDDELFLCGRRDRQVKIRGNAISLDQVESASHDALSVLGFTCERTVAIVSQQTQDRDQPEDIVVIIIGSPALQDRSSPCAACSLARIDLGARSRLCSRIQTKHGGFLLVPSQFYCVEGSAIERLATGKLNLHRLKHMYNDHVQHVTRDLPSKRRLRDDSEEAVVLDLVRQTFAPSTLRTLTHADILSSTWSALGGNSLHAAMLSWEVHTSFGKRLAPEHIIHLTIGELIQTILRLEAKRPRDMVADKPIQVSSQPSVDQPKRAPLVDCSRTVVEWYSRYNSSSDGEPIKLPRPVGGAASPDSTISLSVVAQNNLGKCIDASPLVVRVAGDTLWVIIGSHSDRIVCLEVKTSIDKDRRSRVVWTQTLDDRIEATAAVSDCDNGCVFVGTYSGRFYSIDLPTGAIRWTFQAKDMIKSSAVVIDSLGLVVVGAYDHTVYALDIAGGEIKHQVTLSGSVFGTPVFHQRSGTLIVPTTAGEVVAMDTSLTKRWLVMLPAPVFSSAVIAATQVEDSRVVVGCADGAVYSLALSDGRVVWRFLTDKPVFCTPSMYATAMAEYAIVGSHDGRLRKISTVDGSLHWEVNTSDSPPVDAVFASPCVALINPSRTIPKQSGTLGIVMAATTTGRLVCIEEDSGRVLATTILCPSTFQPPPFGDIFSSPVIVDSLCFVGTRGNHLLVFDVAVITPATS